ncbi:MAG: hypothetical protein IIA59_00610 [Candidatus Marinimicrobia bacterium]|nr:hypothetical protein [Candidatus Neomarinimicrobiota bacterium]
MPPHSDEYLRLQADLEKMVKQEHNLLRFIGQAKQSLAGNTTALTGVQGAKAYVEGRIAEIEQPFDKAQDGPHNGAPEKELKGAGEEATQ